LKKIFHQIKEFIQEDFSWKVYLSVACFLGIFITLNYYYEIEDVIIDKKENRFIRLALYLLLYSTAYYGTLGIYYIIEKKNLFTSREFFIKSFIAFLLISVDASFIFTESIISDLSGLTDVHELKYLRKVVNQAIPIIFYFFVLYLVHQFFDKNRKNLYGIAVKGFHWQPYFVMLMGMLPLLTWASFQQDFTREYPYFKYWEFQSVFNLSQLQLFAIYETFYLLDFINVEMVFRGLLVVGMIKCLGNKAVLPMVVMYAFLHFGKPPAETISSVFGGYILGAIAYKTENILGGFMIHMGIALLMDSFAIIQVQLF